MGSDGLIRGSEGLVGSNSGCVIGGKGRVVGGCARVAGRDSRGVGSRSCAGVSDVREGGSAVGSGHCNGCGQETEEDSPEQHCCLVL